MTIELVYPNTPEEQEKFGEKFNKKEIHFVKEYSLIDESGSRCRQLMRSDDNYDPSDRRYYTVDPTSLTRRLLQNGKQKYIETTPTEIHYTNKNGVSTKIEVKGIQFLNVINPIVIFSQPAEVAMQQKMQMMKGQSSPGKVQKKAAKTTA